MLRKYKSTTEIILNLLEEHKKLTASSIYGLVRMRLFLNSSPFKNVSMARLYLDDLCEKGILSRRGKFYSINKNFHQQIKIDDFVILSSEEIKFAKNKALINYISDELFLGGKKVVESQQINKTCFDKILEDL